ncbi:Acm1p [Kluyveromyces lactis]|uniref:KLLA0D00616p n=1 Tax=Kluyveromyces lactis (strain ATCC 8585 / CBS 2359 / DSM 70799 / NBRC 1267 / NRRL Y-1140 / WM37) TaxID=284590 RepID=Q6CSJ0_KLULA|nr:uncharacterized protein KLLA0_D00616g [Kluyveromyces lactis]CAH00195.1 KLLA0D00616p [Kluyveromyces lactis]|eukprot:XP_453099.1 uncharacterized protein KLLA0_D00616g [Kluyveromyces lactis]
MIQHRSPLKKRAVLTSKNVNIISTGNSITKPTGSTSSHGSPRRIKTKLDVERALQKSPVKQVFSIKRGSPKKKGDDDPSSFAFYEESEEDRAVALMRHVSLRRKAVHDENEQELENIDENKLAKVRAQATQNRGSNGTAISPLQDLDIELFPGTIQYRGFSQEHHLNLHLNHTRKLPEYITPPRNAKLKDFFVHETHVNDKDQVFSKTTDDINANKVVRKLQFCIDENR